MMRVVPSASSSSTSFRERCTCATRSKLRMSVAVQRLHGARVLWSPPPVHAGPAARRSMTGPGSCRRKPAALRGAGAAG
jgi:hypothetical protein